MSDDLKKGRNTNLNSIKRRSDRLERQVRRWRIFGCAAAGWIAVPLIMGTTEANKYKWLMRSAPERGRF